ncbi:Lsr2 family DNA-binding protein [Wenjunlia tyrosinilytica]|uniref:Lsr2 DNA-binding domain-containing protein n=1 Tax=Wenjunlia tyrosinilytica TaxID=1544741 RepID=A0A917ZW73_9ACTN|nr:Lsr2 family protein [Wenjunlia tyrosinilytica]GGO98680.1 hypothetical protein GCM10012280_63380 [Wenjunlia tyrosinilytica]
MPADSTKALEPEGLPLEPNSNYQFGLAARVTARHAHGKDDLAHLLGVLGLPRTEDDLVRLLPLLNSPTDEPDQTEDAMTTSTPATNAYTAVAVSMLNEGTDPDSVRTTLGLSEEELTDALEHVGTADADADALQAAGLEPVSATDPGAAAHRPAAYSGIEALLTWGEQHRTKGVQALTARARTARARTALAELAQRRDTEHAVADAEAKVGQLESELALAREALRRVKNGKPTAPAAPAPVLKRRTKQELAAIRTWARAGGHQVADRGLPAQAVLDAHDAAHPTTPAQAR